MVRKIVTLHASLEIIAALSSLKLSIHSHRSLQQIYWDIELWFVIVFLKVATVALTLTNQNRVKEGDDSLWLPPNSESKTPHLDIVIKLS